MVVAHRPTEQILSNSSKAQVSTCLADSLMKKKMLTLDYLRGYWLLDSMCDLSTIKIFFFCTQ